MIVLDKLIHGYDTMLIPLNLLINMEGLKLREDLDHCLLHTGFHHQGTVVRGCESLLSNFYAVDWSHSISYLVVLFCHELTTLAIKVFVVVVFKNEDFTFLSEVDFV